MLETSHGVTSVVNVCGRTTLAQAVALIARVDLFLGNESSLLHIAVAMDRPEVCILGGGHRGQFFPWGDPAKHQGVSVDLDCVGCNWQCKHDKVRCIEEVSVSQVLATVGDMLDGRMQAASTPGQPLCATVG